MVRALIFFDGSAAPSNPGNCSCGAVIDLPSCLHKQYGSSIVLHKALGYNTCNYGEYNGLIIGCQKALELGIRQVKIKGDSQLVIYQLQGKYSVKSLNLLPLYRQAKQLLQGFDTYSLEWIPRAQNQRADAAARGVHSFSIN